MLFMMPRSPKACFSRLDKPHSISKSAGIVRSISQIYNLSEGDYLFKEKGWREENRQYYIDVRANPIKNFIAMIIGKWSEEIWQKSYREFPGTSHLLFLLFLSQRLFHVLFCCPFDYQPKIRNGRTRVLIALDSTQIRLDSNSSL
jgi:hypothetical protein